MPGQDGLPVAIATEAARGPVCVEHEPAITPRRSVGARHAMESVLRLPIAPGECNLLQSAPVCGCKLIGFFWRGADGLLPLSQRLTDSSEEDVPWIHSLIIFIAKQTEKNFNYQ